MNNRILFCTKSASDIYNIHKPYIDHYKKHGYEIHSISDGFAHLEDIDTSFDVPMSKKRFSIRNIIAAIQVSNIIKKQNYDIISIHSNVCGLVCRLALKLAKVHPYVVYTPGRYNFENNNPKSKISKWVENMLSKTTDAIITTNKDDYNTALKHKLCDNIILTNSLGIDPEKFPILDADSIRAQRLLYGAYDESTVILCSGEFSKRRNQQMIIKAFKNLRRKKDNVFLVFTGNGDSLESCKKLAKKLRLEDDVHFLKTVDDINLIYRSADIVVSSSTSDGLPFNIMESLFCGVPIVASLIKGHSDLLKNNFNSLLFNPKSVSELESCLYLLVDDNKLYKKIKSNCYLPEEFYLSDSELKVNNIYEIFYKKA